MWISILIFLGVLSFLVFVHELGHFFAAKACGIYVDQFSIGMPPRLFGVKWGETDYCIGLLPIGGYVKMAGQEDKPLSEEERESTYGNVPEHRWFNKKPFWQKFIVLFAGPFMNLVVAVLLYTVVVASGMDVTEDQLEARVGKIEENSPAASAPLYAFEPGKALDAYTGEPDAVGWQTGDVILEIDGRPVNTFMDLTVNVALAKDGEKQHAVIERRELDGKVTKFVSYITPALLDESDEFPRYGVTPFNSVLVSEVLEGMPAEAAGLKPGDIITHVDGRLVEHYSFGELIEKVEPGTQVTLRVLRGEHPLDITFAPATIGKMRGVLLGGLHRNSEYPVEVKLVDEETEAVTGLQRRDRIVSVNGDQMTASQLLDYQKEHPGEKVLLAVERPRILFGLIQKEETLKIEFPIDPVRAVGVSHTVLKVKKAVPPSRWLGEGLHESAVALDRMWLILSKLFVGDVSPKQLGGPIMIGQVASEAARIGWQFLLHTTAFISINLFVLNLLPLPVLDGGQIVVNSIEAVRRKPLNPRFLEYFQFAGIILLITLMLYVTKNDLGRWVVPRVHADKAAVPSQGQEHAP